MLGRNQEKGGCDRIIVGIKKGERLADREE